MREVKNQQNADTLLFTGDEFPCSYPQASAALVRCLNIPLNIDKLKRVLFRLDSYYWKISLEHLRSLFLKQKTPSIISASSLTCTGSLFGLWVQWLLHKWLQVVMLRRQPDPEISGFGTECTWQRHEKELNCVGSGKNRPTWWMKPSVGDGFPRFLSPSPAPRCSWRHRLRLEHSSG